MKKCWMLVIVFALGVSSCETAENIPDVSGIRISLKTQRFEKDFFALDTLQLAKGLGQLQKMYPVFTPDFIGNILGLSTSNLNDTGALRISAIKNFLRDYRPLKDSSEAIFGKFEKESKDIKKSFQYIKYYFPRYKLPENITTFIGPIDAYFQTSFGTTGDVITRDGIGIGLQLHLGSNFSYYNTATAEQLYPSYISKNFTPESITVNCVKNVIDDMYEDKSMGRPLIEQMVEKGKRLYLLDKLTPHTPAYIKIGYTQKQLESAYRNEAVILDFFLKNELLNNAEQNINKNYIGESPKTQELGEDAPGNIGAFTGWQIVKKFMSKNPEMALDKMMTIDARELYAASNYKPRSS